MFLDWGVGDDRTEPWGGTSPRLKADSPAGAPVGVPEEGPHCAVQAKGDLGGPSSLSPNLQPRQMLPDCLEAWGPNSALPSKRGPHGKAPQGQQRPAARVYSPRPRQLATGYGQECCHVLCDLRGSCRSHALTKVGQTTWNRLYFLVISTFVSEVIQRLESFSRSSFSCTFQLISGSWYQRTCRSYDLRGGTWGRA